MEALYLDNLMALIKQESSRSSADYLFAFIAEGSKDRFVKCRCTMANWCYTIVEYFDFSREIANVAILNADRFFSTRNGVTYLQDHRSFQLVYLCSLLIAIKLQESTVLNSEFLMLISRDRYSIEEMVQMEQEILFSLEWKICSCTPSIFLEYLLELFLTVSTVESFGPKLRALSHKQIDAAIQDYSFVGKKSSAIALASFFNAMEIVGVSKLTQQVFIGNISSLISSNKNLIDYNDFHRLRLTLSEYCDRDGNEMCTAGMTRMFCCMIVPSQKEITSSQEKSYPMESSSPVSIVKQLI